MRSQRDGGLSTITQVKGYSLEITMLHGAKGSISWKPESLYASKVSVQRRAGVRDHGR